MDPQFIIMIIAGLLTLGLLGLFIWNQRGKEGPTEPDYRVLFILGITWVPVGIATDNPGLWGLGVAFLVIGIANRDKWSEEKKWSELPPEQRRAKFLIILGLTVLLALGVLSYAVAGGSAG